MKDKENPTILNKGSLMTFKDGETECHLGYLIDFGDKGIFEPTLGRVAVMKSEADEHNRLLSKGEVEGLDTCPIGIGRDFFLSKDKKAVTTWKGDVVSTEVRVKGKVITFYRGKKTFSGRLRKNTDSIYFQRVD